MLVLSRMRDESVIIRVPPSKETVEIRITQIEIRGDKSRLGFQAPRKVIIHREEVQQAIDKETVDRLPKEAKPTYRPGDV